MGSLRLPFLLFFLGILGLLSFRAAAGETGVSPGHIAIGMSTPLSGPNAAYGTHMKEVIEAYFRELNAAGGIHGRKLELHVLDDGYETERTLANTRELITGKQVFALLGFYGSSPTTEAMNTVFGPARVPLIGTISGAESLRPPREQNPNGRYMFNVRASYADETAAIVNQLVSLGLRNVAVVYQNDGFGKSGLEGVIAALANHRLTPSAVASIERNSLEVAPAVAKLREVNPQAVVMVTLYKPTAEFVRQMKRAGQHPQFMTLSSVGAELLVEELGEDARGIGISQVMPYPWNDTTPLVAEYHRLNGKPGRYSYYGVEAYVTARVLVEGLRRAGKQLGRERLIATLESLRDHDLGGYRINYSPSGRAGSRFVDLTVIGSGGRVLR